MKLYIWQSSAACVVHTEALASVGAAAQHAHSLDIGWCINLRHLPFKKVEHSSGVDTFDI